ncbi:aspartate/glutamate racemase family protein [Emticicia sp. C21]|uniref:aspartate/glutamate racemase family protein n=1 Tax=Emticicia sp. C21 TaxID=2302915 RepID=UPI001E53DECF|nr:aspartate/glutamate racemase family protein [Emticicia sp. C21]
MLTFIEISKQSMKKIGLVGGISWVSTIDYYRYINEGINQKLGGFNFAECIIYSLNFDDFQRNNTLGHWDNTYQLIFEACQHLQRAGAEAIVLCANTAHAVADRLENSIDLPIIHIVSATAKEINGQGFKKVGLLGTKFTMEMDFYLNKLWEYHIEAFVPESQKVRDYIQQTLKEELGKGLIRQETKEAYLSIIKNMINQGAEGIIFGCTEIPMLLSQKDVSVRVFDTTFIHANAAVEFALSAG